MIKQTISVLTIIVFTFASSIQLAMAQIPFGLSINSIPTSVPINAYFYVNWTIENTSNSQITIDDCTIYSNLGEPYDRTGGVYGHEVTVRLSDGTELTGGQEGWSDNPAIYVAGTASQNILFFDENDVSRINIPVGQTVNYNLKSKMGGEVVVGDDVNFSLVCMDSNDNFISLSPNDPIHVAAETPFSDISGHTFEDYILNLYEDNVISGFSDGTFRPDQYVTRAQMSKFVALGLGFETNTSCGGFSDVSTSNTFYDYITTLKCEGVISGYADGSFKPDDLVTRGQAMKFLIEGARQKTGNPDFLASNDSNPFSDLDSSHTFYSYIMAGYSNGIVSGSNGMFMPDDSVTRGGMSKMVDNTRGKI